jgi:hypothetical protein
MFPNPLSFQGFWNARSLAQSTVLEYFQTLRNTCNDFRGRPSETYRPPQPSTTSALGIASSHGRDVKFVHAPMRHPAPDSRSRAALSAKVRLYTCKPRRTGHNHQHHNFVRSDNSTCSKPWATYFEKAHIHMYACRRMRYVIHRPATSFASR